MARIEARSTLAALVLLWLAVCVPGLLYGLPQLLDPDETRFTRGAFQMLLPPYLDPGWYGAPASTLMDVLAPLYGLWFLIGKLTGSIESPYIHFVQHPEIYILLGRIVTATAMLAATCAMFIYARSFLPPRPAVVAALVFLFSPGVVHYSQITRMDIFMILFLILVFHFSNRILYSHKLKYYVLAGAALGASVASKYPGVVGAAVIVLAAGAAWSRQTIGPGRCLSSLSVAALSSVATAFVLGPFLFINFGEVLADVAVEADDSHLSATAPGFLSNAVFYLWSAIPDISGPVPAILGLVGLVFGLARGPRRETMLILAFGLCFLAFVSALLLQWTRWALPMACVVAVGAGLALHSMAPGLRTETTAKRYAAVIAALLVVAPTAMLSAKNTYLKATDQDTRSAADRWIQDNVAKGSRVAVETYAPQLSTADYDVLVPRDGTLKRLQEVWIYRLRPPPFFGSLGDKLDPARLDELMASDVDFIVISNWEDRYRREMDKYRRQYGVYACLRRKYAEVRTFEPGSWRLGPRVTILQSSGDPAPPADIRAPSACPGVQ